MSLIVALLGKKCGVVASDSIKVSPEGIASFDFNKTFSIEKPQMICAHVGLLDFMGIKIEAHLLEITFESRFKNLRETINRVRSELIKKLNSSEIVFEERKVELLMLSRKNFSSGRYEIRAINLKPNPEKKIIGSSLFQVGKPKFSFPAIR